MINGLTSSVLGVFKCIRYLHSALSPNNEIGAVSRNRLKILSISAIHKFFWTAEVFIFHFSSQKFHSQFSSLRYKASVDHFIVGTLAKLTLNVFLSPIF